MKDSFPSPPSACKRENWVVFVAGAHSVAQANSQQSFCLSLPCGEPHHTMLESDS